MRPFPERPRNNRAFKKAAIPASAGDIEAHCQVVALDAAFVCAVGARRKREEGRMQAGRTDLPKAPKDLAGYPPFLVARLKG